LGLNSLPRAPAGWMIKSFISYAPLLRTAGLPIGSLERRGSASPISWNRCVW
jgi:hypothetical protein